MSRSLSLRYILTLSLIYLSLKTSEFKFKERSIDSTSSLDNTHQDTLPPKSGEPTKVCTRCTSTVWPSFAVLCYCRLLFQFLLHNLVIMLYPLVMLLMFSLILVLIFLKLTFRLLFERVNTLILLILCLILYLILNYHLYIVLLFLLWTHAQFSSLRQKPFLSEDR